MRRILTILALAAGLTAPAAQAAVTYTFRGSMTLGLTNPDDPQGDSLPLPVDVSFTLTTADFITNGTFSPQTCSSDNVNFTCGAMEFDNDPNNLLVGGDFLSFGYSYDDGFSVFGGGNFYFFQPGAFGATGTYTTDGWPTNGPPVGDQDYACCYGSAGPATLIVSGQADTAVPEPGAWSLMIFGLGGAGALLRRRRALASAA